MNCPSAVFICKVIAFVIDLLVLKQSLIVRVIPALKIVNGVVKVIFAGLATGIADDQL
jgi:hypothetical protein